MLYILGLTQVEQGGKVLIKPSSTPNTLLDSIKRAFSDKFPHQNDSQNPICTKSTHDIKSQTNTSEIFDSHIFPLLTLWNNRLLFLRLLESMLLNFKHITKPFLHTDTLRDFSDIATLFFKVLAVKKRTDIPQNLADIPYLNSSLFEKSALEAQGYEIALLESRELTIAQDSILRRDSAQNALYKSVSELPLLEYLFAFLHAYNFTTMPRDIVDFAKTNHDKLINSAVLGLVFEKLNGYKEGSFYTPSFITRYMCQQSIRKVVVQKFNEANPHWSAKTLKDIEYEIHREIRQMRQISPSLSTRADKGGGSSLRGSGEATTKQSIKSTHPLAPSAREGESVDCHSDFTKSVSNDNSNATSDILAKHNRTFLSISICDPAVGSGHFLVSALNELLLLKYELGLLLDSQGRVLKDIDLSLENDELIITDSNGKMLDYTIPAHENIESHKIQKAIFTAKKELIENCLFGVDINPNSVEICKLRLWIELLKYSYYENLDSRDLQTLPNIDINIKCGNSLISRFSLKDSLKHIPNIAHKIAEYQKLVFAYKNADSSPIKIHKRDIEAKINALKETFRLTLKDPKTKASLERAITEHITLYGNFLLDNESLLDGLEKQTPNLFGNENLSEAEQEKAAQSYANIKLLRHKLDSALSGAEYKGAFEWRFEFPEVLDKNGDFMGFDLVIGNPPYIRQEAIKELKPHLAKAFSIFTSTADIFTYFYEQGFKMLKPHGILSLITSNKFCRAGYGANLREFLLQSAILEFVDLNGLKVFDKATVDTCIVNLCKAKPTKSHTINYLNPKDKDLSNLTYTQISQNALSKEAFIFGDSALFELKSKIESIGIPLKEWDIAINYGIKTGYNEAFIIDTATKDEILSNCDDSDKSRKAFSLPLSTPPQPLPQGEGLKDDTNSPSLASGDSESSPSLAEGVRGWVDSHTNDNIAMLTERERTEQIIKPILRGRDIKRYSYEWANLWLINTHNGYESKSGTKIPPIGIGEYPALKAHLDRFYPQLQKRNDKGATPYNLRNCAYIEDFEKEKIIYKQIMAKDAKFCLDNQKSFTDTTATIITGANLKYILGLLNSKIIYFAMRTFYMGGGIEGEFKVNNLEKLPIPKIDSKNKKIADKIVDLVDRILESRLQGKDTKSLELKIDDLVFELYKLDSQEIDIINA